MSSFREGVHVPGVWRCAKCGFRLVQSNLNAEDGTVTPRDEAGDDCPNDGSPLWRVSWREDYLASVEMSEPAFRQILLIDQLRSQEMWSVTIMHDNPDEGPRCVIVCEGEWVTGLPNPDGLFSMKSFFGETVLACLESAHAEMTAWRAAQGAQS